MANLQRTLVTLLLTLTLVNVSIAGRYVVEADILGMTCQFCAFGLHKKLNKIPSVTQAKVSLRHKKALIFARDNISKSKLLSRIKTAVTAAGYQVKKIRVVKQ